MLQYGLSVKDYLFDSIKYLKYDDMNQTKYYWKLADYNLPDNDTLDLYSLYHDFGKQLSLIIYNVNKRHYPYHEIYSYHVNKKLFNNKNASELPPCGP